MRIEIVWSLVAFGGFIRAVMLWREAVLDRLALRDIVNGKRLLARWQIEHASMGILVYFFLLCAGLAALSYRLDVIPLQTRLLVASLSLVAALITLATRQERDAYYRRVTLEGRIPDENAKARAAVFEIQQKVTEMHEDSKLDRPAEETDRAEGREHRRPEEAE